MTTLYSENDIDMSTVKDVLAWARGELQPVFPLSADIEARAILSGLLGCSLTHLILNQTIDVPARVAGHFQSLVARRRNREPVAYLLQNKNFLGRDFYVDSRVLIPRPETEFVVEEALALLKTDMPLKPRVADVGTGSGCIGLSLAAACPDAEVLCLDISSEALAVARRNAEALHIKNADFIQSDVLSGLQQAVHGDFDMIISNPPYIARDEFSSLEKDLFFEPLSALDGGETGLAVIETLVSQARHFLKPGGRLVLEIGARQGRDVRNLLNGFGFGDVTIRRDYLDRDRLAQGVFCGSI